MMNAEVARERAEGVAPVARLSPLKLVTEDVAEDHGVRTSFPSTGETAEGRVVHHLRMANSVAKWQILSADPDRTAKFYASLFGWRVDAKNALGYRELKTSNGIDGGVWPAPPEAHDFVQLFVEVDDIDAAIAKATSLGGTVMVPKSALPDGDTMAILCDPRGLSFGLMAKRP